MRSALALFVLPLAAALTTPAWGQVDAAEEAPPIAPAIDAVPDDENLPDFSNLFGDLFGDVFRARPLSVQEEARIPQAELVIAKIFPDGSLLAMMDDTLKPMLGGVTGKAIETGPAKTIASITGMSETEVSAMDEADRDAAMAIIDPVHKQRSEAFRTSTIGLVTRVLARIEPAYQAGLARAYAQRFTNDEMIELNRFFMTPVGSRYAAESISVFTDPQVMSAMSEMIPKLFELLPEMVGEFGALGEAYAAPRKLEDLSASEKAQLSALLGVAADDIE
ncbi:DUF2059 domain-containing protein [Altererythrobacter aquiaggeris]|uniref:DUF2059 domain-containing protein n=1 Tax=Aestuarierythrobacter aquiaggeris TaxID=1898396 RepID=UPI0030174CC3